MATLSLPLYKLAINEGSDSVAMTPCENQHGWFFPRTPWDEDQSSSLPLIKFSEHIRTLRP